jgi:hypothetical protein
MDSFAKRLTALTQALFVLTIVTTFVLMRNRGSERTRDNREALELLGRMPALARTSQSTEVYAAFWNWLATNNKALNQQRLSARSDLSKWIISTGNATSGVLAGFAGKGDTTNSGKPFCLEDLGLPTTGVDAVGVNVSDAIAQLALWSSPLHVRIVTSFIAPAPAPALPKQGLTAIQLNDQNIVLSFETNPQSAAQGPSDQSITLPINTTQLDDGPSLLDLLSRSAVASDLQTLARNAAGLKRLNRAYGFLPVADAKAISADALAAAYKGVDLFGFSVPVEQLPWAVMAVTLVILILLTVTIRSAPTGADPDIDIDSLLYPVLRSSAARLVAWVLIPVFAILAVAPYGRQEPAVVGASCVAAVLFVGIGGYSWKLSRRVWGSPSSSNLGLTPNAIGEGSLLKQLKTPPPA